MICQCLECCAPELDYVATFFQTPGFGALEFSDFEMFGLFGCGFVLTPRRCRYLVLDYSNSVFADVRLWDCRTLGFHLVYNLKIIVL